MRLPVLSLGPVRSSDVVRRATVRRGALAIALALLCCACGGVAPVPAAERDPVTERPSTGGEATGTGEPIEGESGAPFGGALTGDLRVLAVVRAEVDDGAQSGKVAVAIDVEVFSRGEAVADATVEAGALGRPVHAAPAGRGHYVVTQEGLARWYEISIASAAGSLRGIRLAAPHLQKVHVQLGGSKTATVRWTPNRDYWVDDVDVRVVALDDGQVRFSKSAVADEGALEVPGSVFDSVGSHRVEVRRAVSLSLEAPQSVAFVEVLSSATVPAR